MQKNINGFTIVELLIVIVVMAVLATISVVLYTGIQNRAHDTTVKSDLQRLHKSLSLKAVDDSHAYGNTYFFQVNQSPHDPEDFVVWTPDGQEEPVDTAFPISKSSYANEANVISFIPGSTLATCNIPPLAGLSKSGNAFIYTCGDLIELGEEWVEGIRVEVVNGVKTLVMQQSCGNNLVGWNSASNSWEQVATVC